MLDAYFRLIYRPQLLVPWYLMTSYLYYKKNVNIISDELYDWICRELFMRFGAMNHPHLKFVDLGQLAAGTGYAIDFNALPSLTKHGAEKLLEMTKN